MNKNKTDFDELWNEVLPIPEDLGFRSWGKETLLAVSSKKIMLKKLEIKAGSKGGLQYHRKRVEAGYIVSGKLKVRIGYMGKIQEKILVSGDHFIFNTGLVHQEEALEDTTIIECSTPWLNDRVRVEEEFGLEIDNENGLPSSMPGEEVER